MRSTLVDLQPFDLLSLTGDDRKKFLQGQVSCNTDALTETQSLSGLICNIKGRVITDFRLFEYQQTCCLQLQSGMAEATKSVLDKYIVFSKAETHINSNQFSRFGLLGNDAHNILQQVFGDCPLVDGATYSIEQTILIRLEP
jgi:folate-binding Fe-S cluster repair protein YgfZ